MSHAPCQWLEDYLAHGLGDAERAGFVAHLAACLECRRAVEEQERLDRLLGRAVTRLEPVPVILNRRIEQAIRTSRRRRLVRWASGVAAGVALAAVVGWWLLRETPGPSVTAPRVEMPQPAVPQATDPRSRVWIRFDPKSEVLAVPVRTDNPNVTIVWVYPGAGPARDARRERSDQ